MLIMTMTRLQMNLQFLGYYKGKINGIKGDQTKNAIRQYRIDNGLGDSDIADQTMIDHIRNKICNIQRELGVSVDGVVGNKTITAYNNRQSQTYSWDNVQHFTKAEFACKDNCGFDGIDINLVKLLEQIREHFGGKPLIISSGCRCAKHNKEVGGVQGSRHTLGKASDIYINGVSAPELLKYCKTLVVNGQARYTYTNSSNMSGVVHIDIN